MRHTITPIIGLGILLAASGSLAATPAEGTLSLDSTKLDYSTGLMPIPNVNQDLSGAYVCDATHPCDDYTLTVDLPDKFGETNKKAKITIAAAATPEYADIDLQVNDEDGKLTALQRDNPPAQPTVTFKPKPGIHLYHVHVVPGTPIPDAAVTITLDPGPTTKSGSANPLAGAFNFALLLPLLGFAALRRKR